jgi:hypothetical protein
VLQVRRLQVRQRQWRRLRNQARLLPVDSIRSHDAGLLLDLFILTTYL